MSTAISYKSPLHEMAQTTPTCLWNDSASVQELSYSIEHGAAKAVDEVIPDLNGQISRKVLDLTCT